MGGRIAASEDYINYLLHHKKFSVRLKTRILLFLHIPIAIEPLLKIPTIAIRLGDAPK